MCWDVGGKLNAKRSEQRAGLYLICRSERNGSVIGRLSRRQFVYEVVIVVVIVRDGPRVPGVFNGWRRGRNWRWSRGNNIRYDRRRDGLGPVRAGFRRHDIGDIVRAANAPGRNASEGA